MTMIEVHAHAVERISTAYHEFLLRYKADSRHVYGIVEGKDDPMFYKGLIEGRLPEYWGVELVVAGGKEKVLKALRYFDWERFPVQRVCFFVDRDLSDFLNEDSIPANNLYITDNYAIENEAVSFDTFKRILEEVFGICDIRPSEVCTIEGNYQAAMSVFCRAVRPIMAQILIWRRGGVRACLNNVQLKRIFRFEDGNVEIKPEFSSVEAMIGYVARCVQCPQSPQDQVLDVVEEMERVNRSEKCIRGKYLLWFMVQLAIECHRSITNLLPRFEAPPKVRITIGEANAMVVVAPRVRCPASLRDFLKRTYVQYIESCSEKVS